MGYLFLFIRRNAVNTQNQSNSDRRITLSYVSAGKAALGLLCLSALIGCETLMPVTATGEPNEYVLNRRDTSMFGSIAKVKQATHEEAVAYCTSQGGKFVEKYSIDKARNPGQWPETTLYFRCDK